MLSLQRGGLGGSMESAGKSVGLLHSIGTSSPSLGGTPHSKKSISNDSAASRGRVACRGHSHGPIHSDAKVSCAQGSCASQTTYRPLLAYLSARYTGVPRPRLRETWKASPSHRAISTSVISLSCKP